MFNVHLFQTATSDIQDAWEWYDGQVEGLGEKFINEVDYYINLIAKNPRQFSVQFSEKYRFANLRKFPYRVVYYFIEESQMVFVTAVFHTSRDPVNF